MSEAGQMEKILSLLLPRLLNRIGLNQKRLSEFLTMTTTGNVPSSSTDTSLKSLYDSVHAKLVEILSHIMKRVRADNACKLPCGAILGMLYDREFFYPLFGNYFYDDMKFVRFFTQIITTITHCIDHVFSLYPIPTISNVFQSTFFD